MIDDRFGPLVLFHHAPKNKEEKTKGDRKEKTKAKEEEKKKKQEQTKTAVGMRFLFHSFQSKRTNVMYTTETL